MQPVTLGPKYDTSFKGAFYPKHALFSFKVSSFFHIVNMQIVQCNFDKIKINTCPSLCNKQNVVLCICLCVKLINIMYTKAVILNDL